MKRRATREDLLERLAARLIGALLLGQADPAGLSWDVPEDHPAYNDNRAVKVSMRPYFDAEALRWGRRRTDTVITRKSTRARPFIIRVNAPLKGYGR